MAREQQPDSSRVGLRRHPNSRDENQYFEPERRHYPVGEYGRDFDPGQDRAPTVRPRRYPVGEFGRDYDARDVQGLQGARDLTRPGGMYSYEIGSRMREPARESFAGRGPANYRRSDQRIHEDVCERLSDDDALDASDIEVEVRDGEVTLSGTVTSRAEKRRTEHLLDDIRGIRDVHNRLTIKPYIPENARSAGRST